MERIWAGMRNFEVEDGGEGGGEGGEDIRVVEEEGLYVRGDLGGGIEEEEVRRF